MKKSSVAGLIVAGGKGKRMHVSTPKQFIKLNGIPILIHALLPFEQSPKINTIVIVLPKKWHNRGMKLLKKFHITKVAAIAPAGKTRQLSVRHGLNELKKLPPDLVVVHDAARPLVTQKLIELICDQAERHRAASAAIEIRDTIIHKHSGKLIERDALLRIQTPQAFNFSLLFKAHSHAQKKEIGDYPDDATLLRAYGVETAFVEGEVANLKITSKGDLACAEAIIRSRS